MLNIWILTVLVIMLLVLNSNANGQTAEPTLKGSSLSGVGSAAVVTYKKVKIDGLNIFYREAGDPRAPTLLLLHGFPSSSRMFSTLIPYLADCYHLIAPDYPGFGHSDAPSSKNFAYTFDNLTDIIDKFTQTLPIKQYALYLSDYGGPVGFRLALAHPERVTALVIQNTVVHQEGLSGLWEARRAFWRNRAANESRIRKNFSSLDATRQRHLGNSPHPERIDPDTWTDEYVFLTRPGVEQIQLDLFYDYQNNLASYPKWQEYLRRYKPPTLVVWGKYDTSFTVAGALAYMREVPEAEVHLLNAGHFALDEAVDQIAEIMQRFLRQNRIGCLVFQLRNRSAYSHGLENNGL